MCLREDKLKVKIILRPRSFLIPPVACFPHMLLWNPSPSHKVCGRYSVLFSMFSNFLHRSYLQNKSRVVLAMKHRQKPDQNLDLPQFSYLVIGSACLSISELCSLLSVEYLSIHAFIVQSFLNMCLYDACSLVLSYHIPVRGRDPFKKTIHFWPIYL